MNEKKRPLSVIVLACIYIAVGAIGFVAHFPQSLASNAFRYDGVWIELTELLAVVCGAFMLQGRNWARWLALAWMAFHVILSAFNSTQEFAIHCLFCAVIAWLLFFRLEAERYFSTARAKPT